MTLIDQEKAIEALDNLRYTPGEWAVNGLTLCKKAIKALPPAQPELIEKVAYIRGFEQGRTQGIIDAQERKK